MTPDMYEVHARRLGVDRIHEDAVPVALRQAREEQEVERSRQPVPAARLAAAEMFTELVVEQGTALLDLLHELDGQVSDMAPACGADIVGKLALGSSQLREAIARVRVIRERMGAWPA